MNRSSPSRTSSTVTLFDGLFFKKYKRWRLEILTQPLYKSSICFKISIRYLWYFNNYALFGNIAISIIFSHFFIITFDWYIFYVILMVSVERSRSDLLEYTLFHIKKIFFIHKNQFLGEKLPINLGIYRQYVGFFLQFLFELLPKLSNFINSDDCIEKFTSKSIRIKLVLTKKNIRS